MSPSDSGQPSDRSSFPAVLHRMVDQVSQSSPHLMRWSDCGSMFIFDPFTNGEAMKNAIIPFFSHGNFASMRRQLSAYQFTRMLLGQHQGYWHHPLFHSKSTDADFLRIQHGRRRRSDFKSQQVDKLKPAPGARRSSKDSRPLSNIDINSNHSKRAKKVQLFPETLHEMLNTLSSKLPHIIGWSENGKAFFLDEDMFLEHAEIRKIFSSYGNFSSIRRQLSTQGFRQISSGLLEGYWYHPSFTSKRMGLHSLKLRPKPGSIDALSSPTAIREEKSDLFANVCPAAAAAKRDVLSLYFCKSCIYMEGRICCSQCPGQHHKSCKTSRCVRGSKHSN